MARVGLLLAVALAALVGCRPRDLAPPARPAALQLALTNRGAVEPDVSALGTDPAALPTRPAQYRRLTAAECRALAIQNAPLADDLDTHPANDSAHHLFKKKPEVANLARLVRGYAADEIRNRAAADALEDYYKLAAAEGQFDLAAAAHGILTKQRDIAAKAIAQGLKDRGDVEAIRRQLLEVESQTAKLEAGIGALNASLAGRLALDPADPTPLWPADPLRVSGEVVDAESAVATAMQCRPDLNLLRVLAAECDSGGLTNAVLNGVNPLLGDTDSSNPVVAMLAVLKKEPTRAESKLRRQLLGLLSSRERQAEAEVRAAVAMLRGNRASAAAKAAEVRNHAARVAELVKREEAGQQVTVELVTARLDLLKARGELVQAVVDWHVSDVKLRQAMGLLVRE
jgi:hypothetical protein